MRVESRGTSEKQETRSSELGSYPSTLYTRPSVPPDTRNLKPESFVLKSDPSCALFNMPPQEFGSQNQVMPDTQRLVI
jgi:hypothetical protein